MEGSPSVVLEWLDMNDTDDRETQLVALELLCSEVLFSDNIDSFIERFSPYKFIPKLCEIIMDELSPLIVLETASRALTYFLDVSSSLCRHAADHEGFIKSVSNRLEFVDMADEKHNEFGQQVIKMLRILISNCHENQDQDACLTSVLQFIRIYHDIIHADVLLSGLEVIQILCLAVNPKDANVKQWFESLVDLLGTLDSKSADLALKSLANLVENLVRKSIDPSEFATQELMDKLLKRLCVAGGVEMESTLNDRAFTQIDNMDTFRSNVSDSAQESATTTNTSVVNSIASILLTLCCNSLKFTRKLLTSDSNFATTLSLVMLRGEDCVVLTVIYLVEVLLVLIFEVREEGSKTSEKSDEESVASNESNTRTDSKKECAESVASVEASVVSKSSDDGLAEEERIQLQRALLRQLLSVIVSVYKQSTSYNIKNQSLSLVKRMVEYIDDEYLRELSDLKVHGVTFRYHIAELVYMVIAEEAEKFVLEALELCHILLEKQSGIYVVIFHRIGLVHLIATLKQVLEMKLPPCVTSQYHELQDQVMRHLTSSSDVQSPVKTVQIRPSNDTCDRKNTPFNLSQVHVVDEKLPTSIELPSSKDESSESKSCEEIDDALVPQKREVKQNAFKFDTPYIWYDWKLYKRRHENVLHVFSSYLYIQLRYIDDVPADKPVPTSAVTHDVAEDLDRRLVCRCLFHNPSKNNRLDAVELRDQSTIVDMKDERFHWLRQYKNILRDFDNSENDRVELFPEDEFASVSKRLPAHESAARNFFASRDCPKIYRLMSSPAGFSTAMHSIDQYRLDTLLLSLEKDHPGALSVNLKIHLVENPSSAFILKHIAKKGFNKQLIQQGECESDERSISRHMSEDILRPIHFPSPLCDKLDKKFEPQFADESENERLISLDEALSLFTKEPKFSANDNESGKRSCFSTGKLTKPIDNDENEYSRQLTNGRAQAQKLEASRLRILSLCCHLLEIELRLPEHLSDGNSYVAGKSSPNLAPTSRQFMRQESSKKVHNHFTRLQELTAEIKACAKRPALVDSHSGVLDSNLSASFENLSSLLMTDEESVTSFELASSGLVSAIYFALACEDAGQWAIQSTVTGHNRWNLSLWYLRERRRLFSTHLDPYHGGYGLGALTRKLVHHLEQVERLPLHLFEMATGDDSQSKVHEVFAQALSRYAMDTSVRGNPKLAPAAAVEEANACPSGMLTLPLGIVCSCAIRAGTEPTHRINSTSLVSQRGATLLSRYCAHLLGNSSNRLDQLNYRFGLRVFKQQKEESATDSIERKIPVDDLYDWNGETLTITALVNVGQVEKTLRQLSTLQWYDHERCHMKFYQKLAAKDSLPLRFPAPISQEDSAKLPSVPWKLNSLVKKATCIESSRSMGVVDWLATDAGRLPLDQWMSPSANLMFTVVSTCPNATQYNVGDIFSPAAGNLTVPTQAPGKGCILRGSCCINEVPSDVSENPDWMPEFDVPDIAIVVDLGVQLIPEAYSVAFLRDWNENEPKINFSNWNLQASNDALTWTTIAVHCESDEILCQPGSYNTWSLPHQCAMPPKSVVAAASSSMTPSSSSAATSSKQTEDGSTSSSELKKACRIPKDLYVDIEQVNQYISGGVGWRYYKLCRNSWNWQNDWEFPIGGLEFYGTIAGVHEDLTNSSKLFSMVKSMSKKEVQKKKKSKSATRVRRSSHKESNCGLLENFSLSDTFLAKYFRGDSIDSIEVDIPQAKSQEENLNATTPTDDSFVAPTVSIDKSPEKEIALLPGDESVDPDEDFEMFKETIDAIVTWNRALNSRSDNDKKSKDLSEIISFGRQNTAPVDGRADKLPKRKLSDEGVLVLNNVDRMKDSCSLLQTKPLSRFSSEKIDSPKMRGHGIWARRLSEVIKSRTKNVKLKSSNTKQPSGQKTFSWPHDSRTFLRGPLELIPAFDPYRGKGNVPASSEYILEDMGKGKTNESMHDSKLSLHLSKSIKFSNGETKEFKVHLSDPTVTVFKYLFELIDMIHDYLEEKEIKSALLAQATSDSKDVEEKAENNSEVKEPEITECILKYELASKTDLSKKAKVQQLSVLPLLSKRDMKLTDVASLDETQDRTLKYLNLTSTDILSTMKLIHLLKRLSQECASSREDPLRRQLKSICEDALLHSGQVTPLPGSIHERRTADTIMTNDFVSRKLTRKLICQMDDSLAIATNALPDWAPGICLKLPFLYPLYLRVHLFRALAFGASRSVIWLQNHPPPHSEQGASISIENMAGLPKPVADVLRKNVNSSRGPGERRRSSVTRLEASQLTSLLDQAAAKDYTEEEPEGEVNKQLSTFTVLLNSLNVAMSGSGGTDRGNSNAVENSPPLNNYSSGLLQIALSTLTDFGRLLDISGINKNCSNEAFVHTDRKQTVNIARLHKEFVRIPRHLENTPKLDSSDSSSFFNNASEVMLQHAPRKTELEIQFIGEEGTGLGPTMEFFALLAEEFSQKSMRMWVFDDKKTHARDLIYAKQGFFPAPFPADDCPSEHTHKFHILGITVAKALQDSRRLNLILSDPFIKLLLTYASMRVNASSPAVGEQSMSSNYAVSGSHEYTQLNWRESCQSHLKIHAETSTGTAPRSLHKVASTPSTPGLWGDKQMMHFDDPLDIDLWAWKGQQGSLHFPFEENGEKKFTSTASHWMCNVLDLDDMDLIYPERSKFFHNAWQYCLRKRQMERKTANGHLDDETLETLAEEVFGCRLSDLCLDMEFLPCSQFHGDKSFRLKDTYSWEDTDSVESPDSNHVEQVSVHNIESYLVRTLQYCLDKGIRAQVEAFISGFEQVFPLTWLALFTVSECRELISGATDVQWTREELLKYTVPGWGYTSTSPTFRMLIDVLVDMTREERHRFLQFTTGCATLPLGGLKNLHPRLHVVRKNQKEAGPYPSVNTCRHYLKLPEYDSPEELKSRLLDATREMGFYLN